jgi:hypothetical protein
MARKPHHPKTLQKLLETQSHRLIRVIGSYYWEDNELEQANGRKMIKALKRFTKKLIEQARQTPN